MEPKVGKRKKKRTLLPKILDALKFRPRTEALTEKQTPTTTRSLSDQLAHTVQQSTSQRCLPRTTTTSGDIQ